VPLLVPVGVAGEETTAPVTVIQAPIDIFVTLPAMPPQGFQPAVELLAHPHALEVACSVSHSRKS